MKKIYFLLFLNFVLILSCQNHTSNPDHLKVNRMKTLDWLTGTWVLSGAQGQLFESWEKANDTTFNGCSFVITGMDTLFTERISVKTVGEEIYFIATVAEQNDGKPVSFKLISGDNAEFVFENNVHDFPQRIIYRHPTNDSLIAGIEGTDKGKFRKEEFRMVKWATKWEK